MGPLQADSPAGAVSGLALAPTMTGGWIPTAGVTDHQGGAIDPERDFFAAPPGDIGEIKSAHSTLKKSGGDMPAATRLGKIALHFGLALLAVYVVVTYVSVIGSALVWFAFYTRTPWWFWLLPIPTYFAYRAWRKTGYFHVCDYVGTEGCVQFTCKGGRNQITRNTGFRFEDASALAASTVHHYRRGSYDYSTFAYTWYGPDSGTPVIRISGTFRSPLRTAPFGSNFSFIRAVEGAWYGYLIPRVDKDLARDGFLKFYMGEQRWARVGRGFLEIVEKDGTVNRCEASEIGSAKMAGGYLTLTRKDSSAKFLGWFGKTGVFHFTYENMYNGRLFLFVMDRFLGVKVE
jgi:hypothetical protein